MNIEPYLCFGGIEVVNAARTGAYLKAGLAGSGFTVYDSNLCPALLNEVDPFVSPEDDEAPWFSEQAPYSGDFLGLVPRDINFTQVLRRRTTELAQGGALVGDPWLRPRTIEVDAVMFASSPEGLSYGRSWLSEVLYDVDSDDCEGTFARILLTCDEDNFREVFDCGVAETPVFAPVQNIQNCHMMTVRFLITVGNSYLFTDGESPHYSIPITVEPGESECVFLEAPDWPGDVVTRIRVVGDSVENCGPLVVRLTPTVGDTCPDTLHAPYSQFTVLSVSAGSEFLVDGRTENIQVYDVLTRSMRPGYSSLDFDGVFRWPNLAPCAKACLCFDLDESSPEAVEVSVDYYGRET